MHRTYVAYVTCDFEFEEIFCEVTLGEAGILCDSANVEGTGVKGFENYLLRIGHIGGLEGEIWG